MLSKNGLICEWYPGKVLTLWIVVCFGSSTVASVPGFGSLVASTLLCNSHAASQLQVRMFRHCVRSTTTGVRDSAPAYMDSGYLYSGDGAAQTEAEGANPAYTQTSDYTDRPLPAWETPVKWCTGRRGESSAHCFWVAVSTNSGGLLFYCCLINIQVVGGWYMR